MKQKIKAALGFSVSLSASFGCLGLDYKYIVPVCEGITESQKKPERKSRGLS